MEQARYVANGFVAGASAIALFVSVVWLLTGYLNFWLGIPVLLFLAVPFALNLKGLYRIINKKNPIQTRVKQSKSVLMALPGVGVACWFFDVLSTTLVINIAEAGTELNPLGWPYSAPAALAYYIPIAFITYYLLYKIQTKTSFYAALAISGATLIMATRSFLACLSNFGPSIIPQYSPNPAAASLEILAIWVVVVAVLAVFNIAAVRKAIQSRRNIT